MTLIVSYISEEFVALVSDRRVTWIEDGVPVRWEDTENKAIVLGWQFVMGYTGFARLGGVPTDRWVIDTIGDAHPRTYFEVLASEATTAVKAMGEPLESSGHAFVAVGYAPEADDPTTPHPLAVTVSNALGRGKYRAWDPTPEFSVREIRLPPDNFKIGAHGMSPPRGVVEETIDHIRRYRKHHPDRTLGVLQLLIDLVRRTAEESEGVSKDVSVAVFPRRAFPARGLMMPTSSGLLVDPIDELTCIFVPERASAERGEVYGPATVSRGERTHGLVIRRGDDP